MEMVNNPKPDNISTINFTDDFEKKVAFVIKRLYGWTVGRKTVIDKAPTFQANLGEEQLAVVKNEKRIYVKGNDNWWFTALYKDEQERIEYLQEDGRRQIFYFIKPASSTTSSWCTAGDPAIFFYQIKGGVVLNRVYVFADDELGYYSSPYYENISNIPDLSAGITGSPFTKLKVYVTRSGGTSWILTIYANTTVIFTAPAFVIAAANALQVAVEIKIIQPKRPR